MYKSCEGINQFMMFLVSGLYEDGITIGFCCVGSTYAGHRVPGIKFDETPEKTLDSFTRLRERLLTEASAPRRTTNGERLSSLCEGCVGYKESKWEPSKKIGVVSFNIYPSPCNIKCIYCYSCINHHTYQNHKFVHELHGPLYEKYFELLEYARGNGFIEKNAGYEVAVGEITVHPYRDRILDFVKGQATYYLTNCVIYDDRIAENLASNGLAYILTSLDAGTAETWLRVKGADCFDKTVSSIEKYCKKAIHPKQVMVKYIMQPGVNTNAKDYEEVAKLVQRLGINRVRISDDVTVRDQVRLTESVLAAGDFLAVLQSHGIEADFDVFNTAALQRIKAIAHGKLLLSGNTPKPAWMASIEGK